MFNRTLQELHKLSQGTGISVSAPVDEDGYYDRLCPQQECTFAFKVMLADWKDKVPDDVAHCPFCGYGAAPSAFNTPEQTAYFKEAAKVDVLRRLGRGLEADARTFNGSQPRHGFVTLRLDYRAPQVAVPLPPGTEEAMTLRIACEACGCRFAVVGAAYFCPACGHNSAGRTFDQSIAIARKAVTSLPTIKAALPDRDTAAQVAKNLTEGTFGSLVTAFQRWAEAEYPHLPKPTAKPRRNAFQNLDEGSNLWHGAGGKSYVDTLSATEMGDLTRLVQQRHLLAHREGVVDQDYLDRTGDTTYAVGQRLVMREEAVVRLADLLDKLVAGLRADLHQRLSVPADARIGRP